MKKKYFKQKSYDVIINLLRPSLEIRISFQKLNKNYLNHLVEIKYYGRKELIIILYDLLNTKQLKNQLKQNYKLLKFSCDQALFF